MNPPPTKMTMFTVSIVPKISTATPLPLPTSGFFGLSTQPTTPMELDSYIPFKFCTLEVPSSTLQEFPMSFHGMGMDIFSRTDQHIALCSSQKHSHSPHKRKINYPGGRGGVG